MTETERADYDSRLPSLASFELGDLATQDPTTEERQVTAGATDGPATMASEQQEPELGNTSTATHPQGEEPPSKPALTGEAQTRSHIPPPIAIPPSAVQRTDSEAIGGPTDLPTPMLRVPTSSLVNGPVIQFTLLLASSGTRHPYQINEKYLAKRNVQAQGEDQQFDPSVISVYTLKELILKDWREDWDAKPSSPSAIRLIFFGQLLADNASLKDCKLNMDGTPNVVHVSVKPQEAIEDEDGGKGGKSSMHRNRDGSDRSPGCRCVVM